MAELNNYIKSTVAICTKLNLPLPWILPSGAIINQNYLQFKTLKVKPFSFVNPKYSFRARLGVILFIF